MPEVVALLSGVQERLTERLGPLKAWLFPRQVYLQLEDEAITAMALEGRRIVWLERVPLPVGLCDNGEPIRPDSLGDLLGDLFVERGYAGARVAAVLSPAASQMRLVRWPDGRWPDDPERMLALNEADLGLKVGLQYLDLHLVDLPGDPPTSLLVTVPSSTLDRWIEVFSLAQVSLERMEAAKTCVCRGLQALQGAGSPDTPIVVLQLEPERTSLLVIDHGIPCYERRLPGAGQPDQLQGELIRWREFWAALRPEDAHDLRLVLHGSALRDEAHAQQLAAALGSAWELLDPLEQGWLQDVAPDHGIHPEGSALAPLWGLASAEVMA
ncbi:MAG: hypothetical protein ACKO5M_06760 [Vulcanococcus sp.]